MCAWRTRSLLPVLVAPWQVGLAPSLETQEDGPKSGSRPTCLNYGVGVVQLAAWASLGVDGSGSHERSGVGVDQSPGDGVEALGSQGPSARKQAQERLASRPGEVAGPRVSAGIPAPALNMLVIFISLRQAAKGHPTSGRGGCCTMFPFSREGKWREARLPDHMVLKSMKKN